MVGRRLVWSVQVRASIPPCLIPGPTRPDQVVPISAWMSPWFQANFGLTQGLAPPDWQPRFGDHLYLAFTNVVAFSPTDTLPLTLRVKALMALQSMISLSVVVVVLARVINILPG